MIPIVLLTDASTVTDLFYNSFVEWTGGDYVIIGIGVLFMLAMALIMAKARSSTAVVVGMAMAFILSIFNPAFAFIFWLAVIGSVFVLVNGVRKWITGQ